MPGTLTAHMACLALSMTTICMLVHSLELDERFTSNSCGVAAAMDFFLGYVHSLQVKLDAIHFVLLHGNITQLHVYMYISYVAREVSMDI